jgi:hypothetical protein
MAFARGVDRLITADMQPTEAGKLFGLNASTVSFSYDKAGRLITETGVNRSVRYELENLATLHLPHELRVGYLSYRSGRVRCGEHQVADIERDDLRREVMLTRGRFTLGLNYDALGRKTWQSAATDANSIGPGQRKLWRTCRYSVQGELAEQADNLLSHRGVGLR